MAVTSDAWRGSYSASTSSGETSSSLRTLTMPARLSAAPMWLAMNMRRYVISRVPKLLMENPSAPPLRLPAPLLTATVLGSDSAPTSGTTTRLPVNTALSPALASSTCLLRTMTSSVRGSEPAGTSSGFSCTLMRCQSTKTDSSRTRLQAFLLPQVGLVQIRGSVYLNCCSMPRTTVLHWMQRKAPRNSSGRTSLVRVTVPWKQVRWPTFSTLRSRSLSLLGML
mmetsp:Transcript_23222/g.59318  ORF Transcript_23222/g.59318 Transcript_23222/m.59318 type:complete len:224 (-) Transcript_23222:518-1189(-)